MGRDRDVGGGEVELLAPNEHAFGSSDAPTFVGVDDEDVGDGFDDVEARSPWLAVLGVTAVAALLAVGIIASIGPDDGADTAPTTTEATTTTVPTSTVPTPTSTPAAPVVTDAPRPTTVDPEAVTRSFVFGGSAPFLPVDVFTVLPGFGNGDADPIDWFELWATPDATRTSGRWIAITSLRSHGRFDEVWPDGVRIDAGVSDGVVVADPDGVIRLMFTSQDGTQFEIGGFGIELSDLLAIAQETQVVPGGVTHGLVLSSLLEEDMRPVTSGPVSSGGLEPLDSLSTFRAAVTYQGFDPAALAQVSLGPTLQQTSALSYLMLPLPELSPADRLRIGEVSDADVVVGRDAAIPDVWLATWPSTRGQVLVATRGLTPSEFVDAVRSVELASRDVWADLVARGERGELAEQRTDTTSDSDGAVIGEAASMGPTPGWQIRLLPDVSTLVITSEGSAWGGPAGAVTATPTVRRFTSQDITFYVGMVDMAASARQMRISVDGETPVDLPMVKVGNSPVFAVGYASTSLATTSIEFLDEAGNPVS